MSAKNLPSRRKSHGQLVAEQELAQSSARRPHFLRKLSFVDRRRQLSRMLLMVP